MSRIQEAMVFKTDEERLAWFNSLTPDERSEVVNQAQEIANTISEVVNQAQEIANTIIVWKLSRPNT
jgi:uncharacterized coiled-coil DUF342 family protein